MIARTLESRLWLANDATSETQFRGILESAAGRGIGLKYRRHVTDMLGLQRTREIMREYGFERDFDDSKLIDIENSVGHDANTHVDGEYSPTMLNMMAIPKVATMRLFSEICADAGVESVAVTVPTDWTDEMCQAAFGRTAGQQVAFLAGLAAEAGIMNILCSARDLRFLNEAGLLNSFVRRITPGVRPEYAQAGDQARVVTPREALELGSTDVVMGRPIYDPQYGSVDENVDRILEEMSQAELMKAV